MSLPLLIFAYVLYSVALVIVALYACSLAWTVFKYVMTKIGQLWLWAYNIMEEERIKRCARIAIL